VDDTKEIIFNRLKKITDPGPGYCHFPDHYPPDYFQQLTAEEKRTKWLHNRPVKYWFLQKGKRNEALDCRVYSFAALRFIKVNFDKVKERLEKQVTKFNKTPEPPEARGLPKRKQPKPRRGGFATNY